MIAFCVSLSVKWIPPWLGQRLSKGYLPPEENLQPTKRGRCSGQGRPAMPPLTYVRQGKHIQGVMSWRVESWLCRWWGAGAGCPPDCRVPAARFRGCVEQRSQDSLLSSVPVQTGQKMGL